MRFAKVGSENAQSLCSFGILIYNCCIGIYILREMFCANVEKKKDLIEE